MWNEIYSFMHVINDVKPNEYFHSLDDRMITVTSSHSGKSDIEFCFSYQYTILYYWFILRAEMSIAVENWPLPHRPQNYLYRCRAAPRWLFQKIYRYRAAAAMGFRKIF
jgi:hypothetical protein